MSTLDYLKLTLRQKAPEDASLKQPLSDMQYSTGFSIVSRSPGCTTYQDFIVPQLHQLLMPVFSSRADVSVLEVGPGQKSVLGDLPIGLRKKIGRYAAFEPNGLFAAGLKTWLSSGSTSNKDLPLPCLKSAPDIRQAPFFESLGPSPVRGGGANTSMSDGDDGFNVILFCHSMYGMNPKRKFIEKALAMLVEQPEEGIVVVFHRDGTLYFDGLVCHQTARFPTGVVRVADDDEALDCFSSFIAGFAMRDMHVRAEWRKVCRALGRREGGGGGSCHGHLLFNAPDIMATFTRHCTTLPDLEAQVPVVKQKGEEAVKIKNREARLNNRPASIVRPTEIRQVQQCVRWALKHSVGLTVLSGGHSGHCLWPNVVSVDMGAFDQIHVVSAGHDSGPGCLVVAGAGCKTGDIVREAMAAGVTVPLGARPSVGAGLWLQGGIGHLARLYGLACDAVVGAVMVGVDSGRVLCVGRVPRQHQPVDALRPDNGSDLLWAIKGAGTNLGIVISVTFAAYPAPTFLTRNWFLPLGGPGSSHEPRLKLRELDRLVASKLPRNCSADAYMYWDAGQLHLGVTLMESFPNELRPATSTPISALVATLWGPEAEEPKLVDSVGMFETDLYMTGGMHGGHGGGKTSSFKRCLFLKGISAANIVDVLVAAVETRPSPLCYLHLLHGGGAVGDVSDDATAFGCRDWDFACVVTGVWPRERDGTDTNRAVVDWVYQVARDLLPLSTGAYGADLGPDPRDAPLAAKAFGPNRPRLVRLKLSSDPCNVLAYACPLPLALMQHKLIILVTGDSCAGKDYCADVWASVFMQGSDNRLRARVSSISDAMKRKYAAATGIDLKRLLNERAYKEQHRPALTAFFRDQVRQRPRLPEETFLNVVCDAADADVLLITGMRDKAPVAALSHLVPASRLLEVQVKASEETRRARRARCRGAEDDSENNNDKDDANDGAELVVVDHRPNFLFENDAAGAEAAKRFAEKHLVPFSHEDLYRLASMVRAIPDFPRPGVVFRDVLNIAQQPGGLALCTSLLETHFVGDWKKVDAVACCEAGGYIFASALAHRVNVPLALVREAGKLPPPTVSVLKSPSHISSMVSSTGSGEKRVEMGRNAVPRSGRVVVVEDVLATGETLCAVLQLLGEAGIDAEQVGVMAVAEFPIHCGRALLRQRGFGRVNIQSLLVFDGE
ncbi:Adenine phosphoribosyltransferase [Colletotrichum tanaceti]|uniref:Adenine phosphoribosyltransferase n=1 Tax=Colletotrichum tanaceti TaxID=1306861 RepID=A0A4U6XG36_9PEZI|nr:Adenine phosphoribosyltransferase [Colletotrichum tanaceti]TKW54212.1 Adenine phosphoribosyltransferase [Colletotrichum tanaceti]